MDVSERLYQKAIVTNTIEDFSIMEMPAIQDRPISQFRENV